MAQPPANSPHSPRLSSSPSQPNFSRATGDRSGQTGSSARTAGASQGCAGAHMAPAPPGPCSHWGKEDASDTCSGEPGKLKQSNLLGVDYFFSQYIYIHIYLFFFPRSLCSALLISSQTPPHGSVPPLPARAVAGEETRSRAWQRRRNPPPSPRGVPGPAPAPSRVGPGAPVCSPAAAPAGGAAVTGTEETVAPASAHRLPRGQRNDRQWGIFLSLGKKKINKNLRKKRVLNIRAGAAAKKTISRER